MKCRIKWKFNACESRYFSIKKISSSNANSNRLQHQQPFSTFVVVVVVVVCVALRVQNQAKKCHTVCCCSVIILHDCNAAFAMCNGSASINVPASGVSTLDRRGKITTTRKESLHLCVFVSID